MMKSARLFFAALFVSILGGIAVPALLEQLGIFSRSAKGVYVAISLIGLWPLVYVAIGIIVLWTLASISLEQASRVMAFFLVYRVAVGLALTLFALTIARSH